MAEAGIDSTDRRERLVNSNPFIGGLVFSSLPFTGNSAMRTDS